MPQPPGCRIDSSRPARRTPWRYRLEDDGVEVLNRCRHADGSVASIAGRATVVPASSGARLRVSFFWPVYGDHWVLALDPACETVLVGAPSRQYAWILSRSPALDDTRLQALLARAQELFVQSQGYAADRLQLVPQDAPAAAR